jgi:thymidine phosphorylase
VASIPLIASSVMSKKLAAGADAIVLDVKCGGGAFMKDLRSARRLARLMVHIGQLAARPTVALITDMSQPLGRAVGDALEVAEAIAVLRGAGPYDVRELSLALGAQMVLLARAEWARLPVEGAKNSRGLRDRAPNDARRRLESALAGGEALAKFRQMIAAQGGDPWVADDPARLPQAARKVTVRAETAGWVRAIDATAIGEIAHDLIREGGPGAGVVLLKKRGDKIAQGEPLAMIHGSRNARSATKGIAGAYVIDPRAVRRPRLVLDLVESRST